MRNEFKKVVCLILAVVTMISLAGCGASKPDSTTQNTEATTTAGTEETTKATETTAATEGTTEVTDPSETTGAIEGATEPSQATTEPEETTAPATQPVAHTHSYNSVVVAATCTANGYTSHTCSCGNSYNDSETAALGHAYVDTVVEATMEEPGYTEHICSRCAYSFRDTYTSYNYPPYQPPAEADVEAAIIRYINQYRAQEGSAGATSVPGLTTIAKIRSQQIVSNYGHDFGTLTDICNQYQYGEYVDMTIHGLDASYNYYTFGGAEAIGHGDVWGDANLLGEFIATGFFDSKGHWRYVGDGANAFIGVGITYNAEKNHWYCCINLSKINYG